MNHDEYDTRSRLPYASKVLPNRPFQARPRLGDWLGRPHAFAIVWATGRRTRRHGVIGRGHIRIGRRRDVLSGEVPSLERQSGRDERSRVRVEFECPGRVRPCGADGLRQRVRSEPSLKASKVVSKLSESVCSVRRKSRSQVEGHEISSVVGATGRALPAWRAGGPTRMLAWA